MKKYLSLLLALCLTLSLAACGGKTDTNADTGDSSQTQDNASTEAPAGEPVELIVFAAASMTETMNQLKEMYEQNNPNVTVTYNFDSSGKLLTQIKEGADCDLFIYVGGESDRWVADALQEAVNKDMVVLNLLDVLGDRVEEEKIVEGMEADEEKGEEDGPEYDEHVWLSLKNAETLCSAISDALQQIDPANKDTYAANAAAYTQKLAALDAEYQAAVDTAARKTILFGDRFPFRYLADDYGLNYYAAFVGCSAETEASFETVSFLARKVDELNLPCVLTIEGAQHKIAETIVQNTAEKNQRVLVMDSMQATTAQDAANGTTYLSVMEQNLSVLNEALS